MSTEKNGTAETAPETAPEAADPAPGAEPDPAAGPFPHGSRAEIARIERAVVPAINALIKELAPIAPSDLIIVLSSVIAKLGLPSRATEHELRTLVFKVIQIEYAVAQQAGRAPLIVKPGKH